MSVSVVVGADGVIRCGVCGADMEAMEYRAVGTNQSDRPWLFYACSGNPEHVTEMLPLPFP